MSAPRFIALSMGWEIPGVLSLRVRALKRSERKALKTKAEAELEFNIEEFVSGEPGEGDGCATVRRSLNLRISASFVRRSLLVM